MQIFYTKCKTYGYNVLYLQQHTPHASPRCTLEESFFLYNMTPVIKKIYNKKPLTYKQQIDLWEKRGLNIPDHKRAEKYFSRISYYRLSAYALPFQEVKDVFNDGTTFDNILNTYLFDRKLRLLILDAIERIEVAIRSQIVYSLAHKYNNSHWQDDSSIFKAPYILKNKKGVSRTIDVFSDIQKTINYNCTIDKPEVFIKHYLDKYYKPVNPPSWMCIELFTIGDLSRLYKGLKDNADRKQIADFFGLHHTVFQSWFHTLTYVRNICAHHARLWNRDFAIKPELLLKAQNSWMTSSFTNNNNRCFYFICLIKYLLNQANPNNHFKKKLIALINTYPDVPVRFIGVPTDKNGNIIDWQNEPLWKP